MTVGLILAGGHSRRFGSDKATYYDSQLEQYWIQLAYEKLHVHTKKVLVAANENNAQQLQQLVPAALVLTDQAPFKDKGPLSGLYAAALTNADDFLIMAVDYPKLSSDSLEKLLQHPNCYGEDALGNAHYTLAHLQFTTSQITDFLTTGNQRLRDFLSTLDAHPLQLSQTLTNQNQKEGSS
ncbi:molybdopterin-guanine dinucleotide biosynthesis protein MobA [Enterococcus canis]|uniref:Molybdopterin-guanine dinucleotide biosynthesis protein MobA n=1 Tax=Enterococcus canis TaxID=214095 RepID=A0A1L8RD13_9ENTE|nr:NTP transferase domain-containing protein [Enterococcus canis]OJG17669.1 molybdopterin-guanine dinucleotide biosynthesis protein MobA [Enterococcus canis]